MKKLSITLFTLMWISLFGFSTSNAAGLGIGVTGTWLSIEADGTETDSNDAGTESSDRTETVDNDTQIGSIYAEIASDNGFAVGIEMTPGAADVSDSVRQRTDTEKSVSGTAAETSNSRTFKAQAEVENYHVVYAELPLWASLYGRIGYAQVDLNTTEVASGNGGSYGNTSLDGINYGVGFKGISGNNVVWKTSYEITDFDGFSLTSSGNSAGSGTNTITADVDTWALRFSLGYQF